MLLLPILCYIVFGLHCLTNFFGCDFDDEAAELSRAVFVGSGKMDVTTTAD